MCGRVWLGGRWECSVVGWRVQEVVGCGWVGDGSVVLLGGGCKRSLV